MNKKGLHWEQLATGILVVLVVILVIGIILYYFVGDSSLFGFLKGTKEKVVTPLEDIDFSKLTASERDKAIEGAVNRDAVAALESANKLIEQGDYENAKRVLGKISSDIEGRNELLEEAESKQKLEEEFTADIRQKYDLSNCEGILDKEAVEKKYPERKDFMVSLMYYWTGRCYKDKKNNLIKRNAFFDALIKQYPNEEIAKRAKLEMERESNQKT